MNMSLDQIIEKRRSQSLKNGRRNEKIRNRTAIRKPGYLRQNERRLQVTPRGWNSNRMNNRSRPQRRPRNMDADWSHDMYPDNGNNRPRPTPAIEAKPSPAQTTFEVAQQVFVGGLDPSMDKETLEKLFSLVDGFQSIEMDYDNANNFKGTAMVIYKSKANAEQAIQKFDGQSLEFNNDTVTMRLRLLGSKISQKTPNTTSLFHSAMDNPK